MISVIIPARNEKFLQKTITNILENAEGDIEIIAICDGYWPDPPIQDDPRVRLLHNTEPRGQRQSINDGARIARGDIIGKLDAHCAVGKGFNKIIERDLQDREVMVPEMYNLDIETWKPKHFDNYKAAVRSGKVNPYMYIGMVDGNLRAQYYNGRKDRDWIYKRKDKKIDETMCCMGPGWFLKKDFYDEIGGCDEGHGHWGQQGVEMACKAWLSGGRMVVNKNTWFAHWFRGSYQHENGRKGFPYSIKQAEIDRARDYSNDLWLNNKWPQQKRTFQWLLAKFNPPKWDKHLIESPTGPVEDDINAKFYKHIHRDRNHPLWKGVPVLKMPSDMLIYSEVIYKTKPEIIVEIGTKYGGSALFFQDMLDLNGGGKVITIDIKDQVENKDPRIQYINGSSIDRDVVRQVKELTKYKRTMLVIDGNHHRGQVIRELRRYRGIVTIGCYVVIEDCYIDRGKYGPWYAKEKFLKENPNFKQIDLEKKFIIGVCREGWIKRV